MCHALTFSDPEHAQHTRIEDVGVGLLPLAQIEDNLKTNEQIKHRANTKQVLTQRDA